MKSALPINSMRFIRGDTCGMYRFNINPEIKAPTMPSTPTASDTAALRNITANTKMNCITASEYRRRKKRATLGMSQALATKNTLNFSRKNSQNQMPVLSP